MPNIKTAFSVALVFSVFCAPLVTQAADVRSITFPVLGANSFRDDFHEPRGDGSREHLGIDIIANKMTPVVAVADGRISFIAIPQASWGYSITLTDADGYQYRYLHLNNDTPGTDDGAGGEANAYASGLARGSTVVKGQQIGWVGDSGNAEGTISHLHFEIRDPNRTTISPYEILRTASGPYAPINYAAAGPATLPVHASDGDVEAKEITVIFNKNLREGTTFEEVREAHTYLTALGFYSGDITDYYSSETREAVRRFQVAKKINPTGLIDGETWNVLNKAYKALPAIVPGAATAPSSGAELSLGAEGLAVRELQSRLKVLGFFTPDITGYFGPVTKSSVMAFQTARGIDPVGFVGPKTKAALALNEASATPVSEDKYIFTKNLSTGSTGTEVQELQKKLKLLGHLNLPTPTTYFGVMTKTAVIAFQKAEGIEPVGLVGPKTRIALNNK